VTDSLPDTITINGEEISKSEALGLVRMLCEDAKQIAGEFHTMNRSNKFRQNWPNEYLFADSQWKSFVEACRTMYAQRLADPKTPPAEARRMHLALVLQSMVQHSGAEVDNRLQIAPGTLQFDGDPFENKKIAETFRQPNTLKDLLLGSAGRTMH
jgi:hypothetical protein